MSVPSWIRPGSLSRPRAAAPPDTRGSPCSFLIGWFVRHALQAPDSPWIGLNQQNCALTVILCRPGLPPSLVSFNGAAHLPDQLRWTGFPAQLRPRAAD
jgi:hypothetical protein